MAVKAMKKLGGEATSPELLNFIRDGSLWTKYAPELQKKLTKLNGNTYCLPIWERSVRTNVDKYFVATGRRRDGMMIYQLRSASRCQCLADKMRGLGGNRCLEQAVFAQSLQPVTDV